MGNFTTEPTVAQTDADSPINETLMKDGFRQNVVDLDGKLFEVYDGTDVATNKTTQDSIAAGAVHRGELDTGQEEQSATLASDATLTFSSPGSWGFYAECRVNSVGQNTTSTFGINRITVNGDSGYSTRAWVEEVTGTIGGGSLAYARIRYINASPPHAFLGAENFGQWLYVLLDDADEIQRSWSADDPPWDLRHGLGLHPTARRLWKAHPGRFLSRPHPWVDDMLAEGLAPGETPAGWSIVLLDLREWEQDVEACPVEATLAEARDDADKLRGQGVPDAEVAAFLQRCEAECERERLVRAEAKAALADLPEDPEAFVKQRMEPARDFVSKTMRDYRIEVRALKDARRLHTSVKDDPTQTDVAIEVEHRVKQREAAVAKYEHEILPQLQASVAEREKVMLSVASKRLASERKRLRERAALKSQRAVLLDQVQARGGGMLDFLHGSEHTPRHSLVEACLGGRSLSEDAALEDHAHIPKIPGLFLPDADGTPPRIRILTPR